MRRIADGTDVQDREGVVTHARIIVTINLEPLQRSATTTPGKPILKYQTPCTRPFASKQCRRDLLKVRKATRLAYVMALVGSKRDPALASRGVAAMLVDHWCDETPCAFLQKVRPSCSDRMLSQRDHSCSVFARQGRRVFLGCW